MFTITREFMGRLFATKGKEKSNYSIDTTTDVTIVHLQT